MTLPPYKTHRKATYEPVKGPDGIYWIVVSRTGAGGGVEWAILSPGGTVFDSGWHSPISGKLADRERHATMIQKCRNELQTYFDKWIKQDGIPIPP